MEVISPDEEDRIGSKHSLSTWARIYLHGIIAFVAIAVVANVVMLLAPVFDFTGNPSLAIGLSIAAILVGPPLVGSFILFGLFPLMGTKAAWRGWLDIFSVDRDTAASWISRFNQGGVDALFDNDRPGGPRKLVE
ncbi:hypothetical protein FHS27_006341 [Rhodopirellula rubra]|uniref:Uncharacterized protein n=1 Tax=Aporhodopirellula rubra TaxID=980271 RepID=A0A7W5E5D0_9BACT|nr:helix-turn-helix domain-containing protein [Aporhodopirellula rubra]MBB3210494.1 hypothetical protein [Aporhodopirellula rubra]